MYGNNLRDLVMSGVTWEITDQVLATEKAKKNAALAKQNSNGTASGNTTNSIVPPIAPIQQISPETASAMAARPADIDSMLRMIAEFNHPLRAGTTNVVLPHIAKNPNGLIILTDMPGVDDDACGQILTGAAGELLDKMLGAIGLSRDTVSVIPMMFWRTPGGRAPTRNELDLARPFVDRLIQMLGPRIILTLGTLPASEIGGVTLPRAQGKLIDIQDGAIKLIPIFHPNYLLLKPAAKRDAWTALQSVQNLLKSA